MIDHLAIQLALRTRLVAIAGLPPDRAWENVTFRPTPGTPFLEDEYIPGPTKQVTLGPNATIQGFPQYVIRWNAVANAGLTTLRTGVAAILAAFPAHDTITLASGESVKVQSNPAPSASSITNPKPGWALVTISVPLWAFSTNAI